MLQWWSAAAPRYPCGSGAEQANENESGSSVHSAKIVHICSLRICSLPGGLDRVTRNSPQPNFSALRASLSRLRDERGLTYDDLAERTGLSRRAIVALATGELRNGQATEGKLSSWYLIARALDVPLGELVAALDD